MLSTFLQYCIFFTKSTFKKKIIALPQRYDEAANAFYEGVTLAPENKELVEAFRFVDTFLVFVFFLPSFSSNFF